MELLESGSVRPRQAGSWYRHKNVILMVVNEGKMGTNDE